VVSQRRKKAWASWTSNVLCERLAAKIAVCKIVTSARTAMKRLKARVIDASGLRAMGLGFKLKTFVAGTGC
jgi:formylmethanofuran dehydrogenase subunit A